MNSTYSAPAAITRGDVVGSTLGAKFSGCGEVISPPRYLAGGSALSFGL